MPSIVVTSPDTQPATPVAVTPEKLHAAVASYPICLVTGGAGYIGSHTVLELLTAGFAVVVIDNLCNSHLESLHRVHYIARIEFERCAGVENGSHDDHDDKNNNKDNKHSSKEAPKKRTVPPIFFHRVDIRNQARVNEVFAFWQNPKTARLHPDRLPIDIGASVEHKTYPMLEYSIDTAKRTKLSPLTTVATSHGRIVCVIHFAALKAVGESISMPLDYYEVNVAGLLFVLKAMRAHAVNTFVFSSSAVVYGMGHGEAISEDAVSTAGQGSGGGLLTNPYGRSKWMSEEIINDFCVSHQGFHATSLRYFNPTGAHPSGLIGENPKGTPNNIVPVILQAYERRRSRVQVFGSSYDTSDGTGVRDYIHVSDLAKGHLAALRKAVTVVQEHQQAQQAQKSASSSLGVGGPVMGPDEVVPMTQYNVYNLGTGRGYSVLEIIKAFSMAAGTEVPYSVGDARQGDLGTVTASADKAATELDWTAEFDLQDMCRDVYNWASSNPGGYEKLRRLSAMSAVSPKDLRRVSVEANLFDSNEDFDSFMQAAGGGRGSLSSSGRSSFSRGSVSGSLLGPRTPHRQSIASLGNLLRTRMSISSASSDEDGPGAKLGGGGGGGGGFGAPFLNAPGAMPNIPTINFPGGNKAPSFKMDWSENSRGTGATDMHPPIREEDE